MRAGNAGKRPQREDAALAALLSEATVDEAAEKAGISAATLYRWLDDPEFRDRYRGARRQVVEHAVSVLQQAASKAVNVLVTIAEDSTAPSSARVSAAKSILDQAFRGLEVIDLAAEVDDLKAAVAAPEGRAS